MFQELIGIDRQFYFCLNLDSIKVQIKQLNENIKSLKTNLTI